jgi:prepilin-type N-terminal cleavage/methylation domain-containing protein
MIMKNEKGFTLIELLVVVAIIGILAAIAIPQFSSYRAQAFCARVESDVKNTVTSLEAQYAKTESYAGAPEVKSENVDLAVDATDTLITTVSASHPNCDRGTFTFTGADGTYAWN